ncbi:hypothetical protein MJM28_29365, partial [Salmonella enterica subsp. enterica serovar Montevideo]|nr:hypothetical protein [Salmonella enterica subsp. enterica serovar Montevideo]
DITHAIHKRVDTWRYVTWQIYDNIAATTTPSTGEGLQETRLNPKDGASPDAADVLMGMYRTDMRHNTAKIAVNVAVREQIEAGV